MLNVMLDVMLDAHGQQQAGGRRCGTWVGAGRIGPRQGYFLP